MSARRTVLILALCSASSSCTVLALGNNAVSQRSHKEEGPRPGDERAVAPSSSRGGSTEGAPWTQVGEDCHAMVDRDANRCRSQDCHGLLDHNAGLCGTEDCHAMVDHKANLCKSADCRAMVEHAESDCESDDCRAIVKHNSGLCKTNNCRAIVDKNSALCD